MTLDTANQFVSCQDTCANYDDLTFNMIHYFQCLDTCPRERPWRQPTRLGHRCVAECSAPFNLTIASENLCVSICPPNLVQYNASCIEKCPDGLTLFNGRCQTVDCPTYYLINYNSEKYCL